MTNQTKHTSAFANATLHTASATKQTKHASTFVNQSISGIITWANIPGTWNSHPETWDSLMPTFSNAAKHTSAFANGTKH